jgi:phosphoglycolate phosphatase-like HAD superfamily hydrolase
MTLVLFDIDGTLIQSGRAGVRGLAAACARLYGAPAALDRVPLAGRTDRAIVSDVLRGLGREPSDEAVFQLRDEYLAHLPEALAAPATAEAEGVLPGVGALMDALDRMEGVGVGLLTGNFERGAALKLGHFRLWERFGFGAFGDHHVDRRDLVPVALVEAERVVGRRFASSRVVVIGDTPADIDCARAHGARSLAVATGPFTRDVLAESGADLVVESLADASLLEWIVRA